MVEPKHFFDQIKAVSYESERASVPLPATGWLLLAGLLGLAANHRKLSRPDRYSIGPTGNTAAP